MVYRGYVRKGQVELESAADLPEGAEVQLTVVHRPITGGNDRNNAKPHPKTVTFEEELDRIWADVPESEWEKLPADLTDQLDHYVYGTPKR